MKEKLYPKKVEALRKKAKENAKKTHLKAIKKLPKKATLAGAEITGDMLVPDYSVTMEGLRVSSWKILKHKPLSTDTFERFDNPLSLQIAFDDYAKWTARNPFTKNEILKSGLQAGQVITVDIPRPLSIDMFLSFICVPNSFWERKKKDENFSDLCESIERIIRANQIDGGLIGVYDSSMVKAVNKIGDTLTVTNQKAINVDITINGEIMPNIIDIE